jgi:hypothetical protein
LSTWPARGCARGSTSWSAWPTGRRSAAAAGLTTESSAAASPGAILFFLSAGNIGAYSRRRLGAGLLCIGKPLGFLGAAAVGFGNGFLFGPAALFIHLALGDRGLARFQLGFGERGFLDGLLRSRGRCRRSCSFLGLGADDLGLGARRHHHLLLLDLDRHLLGAAMAEALLHGACVRPLESKRAALRVVRVLGIAHQVSSVATRGRD